MSCDIQPDISAIPTGAPGPTGSTGASGSTGATGPAGVSSVSALTASFVAPAVSSNVTIAVDTTAWMFAGAYIQIEVAGYYQVVSIGSATSATVKHLNVATNATAGSTIPSGSKLVPSGPTASYASDIVSLGSRITALENTVVFEGGEGAATFISDNAPSGLGEKNGDIWFKTNQNNRPYRYQGGVWVDVKALIDANEITHTMISDAAILARHVGTNTIIADTANIANGTIIDAHIANLSAAKITAGNIGTVNIGMAGRIYNPAYPSVYFRSIEITSALTDPYVSGAASSFLFTHPTPAHFVGPGHASAGVTPIINPDDSGNIRIDFSARILGDTPDIDLITVYYRKNDTGSYIPIAAISSDDAGNQVAVGFRELSGFLVTDSIKFYAAPCNGSGDIASSVTCRVELDVKAYNW